MVSSINNHRVLQTYAGNTSKVGNTPKSANTPNIENAAQPSTHPTGAAPEQRKTESAQVSFSLATQAKQKLNAPLTSYQQQLADTKKANARERVAQIKQRVDELKRLVSMFGALATKALLRELKQLASELKSAANELKEGWGSSAGAAINVNLPETTPEVSDSTDDSLNSAATDAEVQQEQTKETKDQQETSKPTPADEASANDPEEAALSATTMTSLVQQTEKEQSQKQRREDQQLLQETVQELKSLFNRLKALLRGEDNDKETQKQLNEIKQLFTDTDSLANQLTSGIDTSVASVNIVVWSEVTLWNNNELTTMRWRLLRGWSFVHI